MRDGIIVEQMKLSEKDTVLAFLKTAYLDNPRQSHSDFWNWHFLQNPCADAQNLSIWLAKIGGRIVGQLAATPIELNVAGETVKAIWILDLIVDPDFRRRGIAKKLALASKEFCPFVLGVNTSKQHSTGLLKGLGWVVFAKIPRYQRILFPGNALKEIAGITPLRNAANLVFAPFRPKSKSPANNGRTVKILNGFESFFDGLWRESRGQWRCSVSRSAAMLDWQFRKQPGKKSEILGCFENDKLMGYAVLFFRRDGPDVPISKAAISDICYHPDNPKKTVDALLSNALEMAVERQAGSMVTDALDPLLQERLLNFGFSHVKSSLQMLANVPPQYAEKIYDPAKWFLTRGDSDISIFEEPNL